MSDTNNAPPYEALPIDCGSNGSKHIPQEKRIGQRIKDARLRSDNDLSVEALSRMSKLHDPDGQGISRTTLLRYESGAILPGAREIRILCEALDVTPSWLFDWQEDVESVSLNEGVHVLVNMIKSELEKQNPLRSRSKNDLVRSLLLEKAKEPAKR